MLINTLNYKMKRLFESRLLKWKENPDRKPLVLNGARQVGKTYILQEFGHNNYEHVAYFNCEGNNTLRMIFEQDYDIERIIRNLSAEANVPIVAGKTLIIIDEIQEIPRGLSSLKYFCENAREQHVAVAGSMLGIALHKETNFPVGKVDMLHLHPMNFEEFLMAMGKDEYVEIIKQHDWQSMSILRDQITEMLRLYYFVGGMPEAVSKYINSKDIWAVRDIQQNILATYKEDISKHAPSREIPRINMVWDSLPSQLAKDNKKFIYSATKKGSRAKEFEMAIQWLVDCGVVHKVNKIAKPKLPLKFYEDFSSFKLFALDCGLLGAMSETPPAKLLVGNNGFVEFKGAFTENYVLQQLLTTERTQVYYYSNEQSTMEIDFVVQHDDKIVPIEVKAEENLRAKSLRQYTNDNPDLKGLRLSMSDYRDQDWMENMPLFVAGHIW